MKQIDAVDFVLPENVRQCAGCHLGLHDIRHDLRPKSLDDMVFVESQSCADTQELIFDVLSEPELMRPLLGTMINYENIKK